jgi:hypothetical protein
LLTVIESGKLIGVDGLIATAFQPEFVIITDCELSGKVPSDHNDAWSQLPLVGFIQEFTCAKTGVDVNAITDATKYTARAIPAIRHIGVRIVVNLLIGRPRWNTSNACTSEEYAPEEKGFSPDQQLMTDRFGASAAHAE